MIHEMSTLEGPSPVEFESVPEVPGDYVVNVTVRGAAIRLGVSERRVLHVAREGRLRGVRKVESEWLIPTPLKLIPGRCGPIRIAGRKNTAPDWDLPRNSTLDRDRNEIS